MICSWSSMETMFQMMQASEWLMTRDYDVQQKKGWRKGKVEGYPEKSRGDEETWWTIFELKRWLKYTFLNDGFEDDDFWKNDDKEKKRWKEMKDPMSDRRTVGSSTKITSLSSTPSSCSLWGSATFKKIRKVIRTKERKEEMKGMMRHQNLCWSKYLCHLNIISYLFMTIELLLFDSG